MPIFTRSYIAAAVIEARAIDQRDDTDLALQRVADLTHLTVEGVAEITREEAHDEALCEDAARNAQACRGCGVCTCDRAATAYEPLTAGEITAFL